MTIEIPLTKGFVALIDDEDYPLVSGYKWHAAICRKNSIYARSRLNNHRIQMHRLIMGVGDTPVEIDHINGNGLDNRRGNLRISSASQNQHNSRIRKDNKSGYKGVSFFSHISKYAAVIGVNGKSVYLGSFDTPEEAARAYNAKAVELFGEFAYLNVIPGDD